MQIFRSITILSLISCTIAYTNTNQVISDIINLNDAVVALNAATEAYQGGLISAVSPAINFGIVETRLQKGVTDCRLLPPATLSETDVQSIIDTVASTLAINNPKAINTLKSKKALFDASYQTSIVELGLRALLDGHLDFEEEIVKRSPADKITAVQDVANIITIALQDGINTFAS